MAKKRTEDPVIAELRKAFGDKAITTLEREGLSGVKEVIPTGIPVIDHELLGVGGLPVGKVVEIAGAEGVAKAQPLDCGVLTPNGFIPIGLLEVGDTITDPISGGEQTVTGVFDLGERKVFRVITNDGGETRCCREHLWKVTTNDDLSHGREGRVLSLYEIKRIGLRERHGKWDAYKWRLPKLAPCEMESAGSIPMDPYLLGLLLGDGGFTTSSIMFSNPEADLVAAVKKRLPPEDCLKKSGGCDWRIRKRKLGRVRSATQRILFTLDLHGKKSSQKFIPAAYKTASPHDRLRLLRGLVDTDGTIVKGGVAYTTSSRRMAADVVWIVRSLGGLASTSSSIPTYTYRGETRYGLRSYRIYIRFPEPYLPFASKKHTEKWRRRGTAVHRSIVDIVPAGRAMCRCIKVSGKHQLYVTDDFIITHNTSLVLTIMASALKHGSRVLYIDSETSASSGRAKQMGVDPKKVHLLEPDTLEEVFHFVQVATHTPRVTGPTTLILWDSLAESPPFKETEISPKRTKAIGVRAQLMSEMMRVLKRPLARSRTSFVIVNQLRDNVGVRFGDKVTTPGGRALKYAAWARVRMTRNEALKEGDENVGLHVQIRSIKCKGAPPWRSVRLRFHYTEGFDVNWSTIECAIAKGVLKPSGRGKLMTPGGKELRRAVDEEKLAAIAAKYLWPKNGEP